MPIPTPCAYCGTTVLAAPSRIKAGRVFCSRHCSSKVISNRHNASRTKVYQNWANMKARCGNPNNPRYADYGGRGITVCEEWQDFAVFQRDMGIQPEGTTIDRIDNDKGYYPGNCRWATRTEQQNNKRDCNRVIYGGESVTMTQLARRLGLSRSGLKWRVDAGWPEESWGLPISAGVALAQRLAAYAHPFDPLRA